MPGPFGQFSSPTQANTTIVTTTETIVATLSGINTDQGGRRVILNGMVELTTGASTTAVVLRIRRGATITDTVIGTADTDTIIGAAGSTDPYVIEETDNIGEVNNLTYVLTVQQTGATGNGTAVAGQLTAEFV